MMLMEPKYRQQINQLVNQILHSPAQSGKQPMEAAIVIDGTLAKELVEQLTKELSTLLKSFGKMFHNMRINLIFWQRDDNIESQITNLSAILLGRGFNLFIQQKNAKNVGNILEYLKKYQSRSKFIFFFTDNQHINSCPAKTEAILKPFLGGKIIWFILGGELNDFQNRNIVIDQKEKKDLVVHQFAPIYDERSRILILGTIPSPRSREQGFYYGHPRNRFWQVVSDVFNEEMPQTINQKKKLCYKHRIAVWDVLASCEIVGASDNSIKNPVPNDLSMILNYAPIEAIFTTGTKAAKLYQKYCFPQTGISAITLPSTSPANCRITYEQLKSSYKQLQH